MHPPYSHPTRTHTYLPSISAQTISFGVLCAVPCTSGTLLALRISMHRLPAPFEQLQFSLSFMTGLYSTIFQSFPICCYHKHCCN